MWSLLSWQNELVTIVLHPTSLSLSWLKPTSAAQKTWELKAHSVIPLDNLEYYDGRICNPTVIKNHIVTFLATHNLKNAYAAMTIAGAGVNEQLVASPIATPTRSDFMFSVSPTLVWDYVYLYPQDDGKFAFYACGIKQEHLLQYKLIAVSAGLRLTNIMTDAMALLHVYRHMQGAAFRHSQLAVTMQKNNNNIEQLCPPEALHRMLMVNPKLGFMLSERVPQLSVALGLAVSSSLYERSA